MLFGAPRTGFHATRIPVLDLAAWDTMGTLAIAFVLARSTGASFLHMALFLFLLASALKQLNRPSESLKQVLLLLQSKSQSAALTTNDWVYWQQKTGNEIANQLYKEGNYTDALAIYKSLSGEDQPKHVRLAATRGMLNAAGKKN